MPSPASPRSSPDRAARTSDDTGVRFGPAEWALTLAMSAIWGSSFLLMAIATDDVAPSVVPLARVAFGAIALALVPAARQRLPRSELPRVVFLGLVWMAGPFLLFPLAIETTGSAVAGMVNGALPVVTVAVTAVFVRRPPTPFRTLAVVVGFAGIAMISLGSIRPDDGADGRGIAMLIGALLCYAVAVNVSTPMQRRYGTLPVLLHVQLAAVLWTLPAGLDGLADSTPTPGAVASLVVLGAVGTGFAFALYGALLARTGPVRGMIGVFFTPIVATVLGVVVRSEPLGVLAVAGMFVVIAGAVMTSRPDPAPAYLAK